MFRRTIKTQYQSTWLSIHFSPNAAVHSFFAALVSQSKSYSLSSVCKIDEIFSLLFTLLKISPLELMLGWLFSKVSNHPLPDLCIDTITKNRTGVHEHSPLQKNVKQYQYSSQNILHNRRSQGDTIYPHVTVMLPAITPRFWKVRVTELLIWHMRLSANVCPLFFSTISFTSIF
jgi:hypothetical protein